MKYPLTIACMIALTALSACVTEDRYPVSGEECGPNDPVKDLDAADCLPPIGT
ncbi:hypothetical protein C8N43_0694 [Litoreibacter ponti]|uniref:Lipoprotein n=1 Tax=Litoreibacter ponti TaxID=1510457 RepID=A0A2T6BJ15_9RHOB|nr:hypothetical protein [Litoreibacter ponti]PTX56044.1 hypothetical protein C8N43_0694 [Litoreibacter ponti]